MMQIYQAESVLDAQLVCDALLARGIDAHMSGGALSGAVGELPAGQLVSVWIHDAAYAARARQIIESFVAPVQPRADSVCSHCGETVSYEFSHCWQCNRLLD